ncbi:MAG: macro domain-containing protein [Sedimentisphaerales bacterium]|nr:macro domain-containing protein [Sedimentisphaerales bacterium]
MSVKVLIGNLFKSNAQTLVNTVNCVGIMGKGIAQEFKKHYPDMFKDYENRCAQENVQLGKPYIFKTLYDKAIINFPTKKHWRSVSRIEDIFKGLEYLTTKYKDWGVTSIAFPPLGCGNGGLEWDIVGPLMYQELSKLDIPVEIYAPYGTPRQKLSIRFLSTQPSFKKTNGYKLQKRKLKPEWLVLVEILNNLQKQPYAKPVGRTIFQKICYIATEMKLDTGFSFGQSSFGPFSKQIKPALTILANSNLISETQLGKKMTAIKVGPQYETLKEQHKEIIQKYTHLIEKVTDLFIRIKNTDQAEEVSTVLFTIKKLKRESNRERIPEKEVFDYILQWKKSWDTDQKKVEVASAIRNLGMMRWIKTDYSKNLPVETAFE